MLTIRLQRKGKKNQPFFKIVVTEEKKSSTRGRFVEELGFYNPLTKERKLKGDRAKYWMSVGAQPSDTVYNMLVTDNIIEGKKRPKHKKSKKKPVSPDTILAESKQASQGGQEEAAPAAAAPAKDAAPQPKADQPQEAPAEAKAEETEKPKEAEASQEQPQEAPAKEPAKTEEGDPGELKKEPEKTS